MASRVRASCTCRMGLEGVVSKRLDAPYRSGPSKTWLKSKNPRSVKPCDVSAGNGQAVAFVVSVAWSVLSWPASASPR